MPGRVVNPWKVAAVSLAGGIVMAAMLLAAFPAWPHEAPSGWTYPWACCSGMDCRPVSSARVKAGPGGYELPNGETVPYSSGKIRPSPDGAFHWCTQGGKDDTPTICLFAPAQAF